MSKIREKDRTSVLNAIAGGVTPRQGIQHIQVGRKDETEAILKDIEQIKNGGGAVRIISASYGAGKAVDKSTRILTETGWREIGRITPYDYVYTRDGESARVTGVYDDTYDVYVLNLEDGQRIRCCSEHLWIVADESGDESVLTTSAIRTALQSGKALSIPCAEPMNFNKAELPYNPYELGRIAVKVDRKDESDFNYIKYPPHIVTAHDADDDLIIDRHIRLGDEYLRGSISQRLDLLTGLIDEHKNSEQQIQNDASYDSNVSLTFRSEILAEQVAELARSLGMSAQIIQSESMIQNDTSDDLVISEYDVLIRTCGRFGLPGSKSDRYVKITGIVKTDEAADMRCITVDSPTHSYILDGYVVTHNTFFLTLSKTVALKQNMMVITADLSPDRRLYSSSGQAQNLYREEMRSLSTPMHPDGGALEELLDSIDEKVMSSDESNKAFLQEIRKLPYGYDAVTVCNKWHIARNPITDKEKRDSNILQDACLRWFASESTHETKKILGVRSVIGDDGAWDALKLIAMLGHFAGYSGLLVELDECVNLYKINNSTSRDRNYEQILRMFNECLQGDARYIGVIFSGTPEFVMDPRRGLFSYDALKSRLIGNEYAENVPGTDTTSPVIDLIPLSQEDLLVLLGNIANVEAMGDKSNWLVNNDDMEAFLKRQYDELGADYYKTPRELLRSWVMLLRTLREHPEISAREAIGGYDVKADSKKSGLGSALDNIRPSTSMFDTDSEDDENGESKFGF